jgi:hypothetical protein
MKNKKLLYVLIPAVLVIWGIIAFRIYRAVYRSDQAQMGFMHQSSNSEKATIQDTINLIANYPDPFLKEVYSSSIEGSVNSSILIRDFSTEVQNQPTIIWPEVRYGGRIKNSSHNKDVFLIQIGTTNYLLKPGEIVENVKLLNADKDSIIMEYQNQQKTIKRPK